jgi:hypothetical protein
MVAIAVVVSLLSLLALTLIGGLAAWRWATGSRHFDAARWKAEAATSCFDMNRWEMVDDLRKHHLSRGMRMREVRRLLGQPDYFDSPDLRGRGVWWEYLTGSTIADCSTLDLRFRNGRLEETAVGQT